MKWVDGHLDLAYLALLGRDIRTAVVDSHAECVSLPALRAGGFELVFGTIFTEPIQGKLLPWSYASHDDRVGAESAGMRQLEVYEALEREGELTIVRSTRDLHRTGVPLPRVLLLMEGADPIRSPAHLDDWHARGVRIVGMSWAEGSRYSGGNSQRAHRPLSPEGRELVHAMDELGIIHDVSHLSDESFDDLLFIARGPVIATHSNCRALVGDSQRHLRDDQIKDLANRGGVIGLNLFGKFITPNGNATVADAIDHVERIASIMGHRHGVALGSDFDGGINPGDVPEGIRPESVDRLARELHDRGWCNDDVSAFAHGNWMRVLEHAL
jgi:membrane dipeptidase